MVPTGYIVRCALSHDTVMAWAFRRALRITGRPSAAERGPRGGRQDRAYRGLMRCFRNERSPMDGLR